MSQKLYQLIVVGLFLFSAFGWGRLMRRFVDRRIFLFHSLTAILGLALLGLLGGILNLLHLVGTPAWLGLFAIGLVSASRYLLRQRPWQRHSFPRASIPLWVAPGLAVAAAWLLLPGSVFNLADDFHTYVTRAMRMAQTGSIAGSAFDSLGLDSLGSPSFFHCFFLLASGVEALNGFDAVACFALCLLLIAELSLRWRMSWWLGLSAMLGLVSINPQYVNISPLYAGAAGILALMVCGTLAGRSLIGNRCLSWSKLAVPMGLLGAWLITMKVTLAFFVAIYLALLLLILLVASVNRLAILKTAAASGVVLFAGVLPWALLPAPAILQARQAGGSLIATAPLALKYPSVTARDTSLLFDPIALLYGDTPVFYLAVCGVAFAIGVAGLVHWLRKRSEKRLCGMAAVAAAGIAMLALLFFNSHVFPIAMAIRYSCPVVIGGTFFVVLGFIRSRTRPGTSSRARLSEGLTMACVLLIVAFNETFLERLDMARQNRTLLAYGCNHVYSDHCREMISAAETR